MATAEAEEEQQRIHCHCHHHMEEVMATELAVEEVGVATVKVAEVCIHVLFHQGLGIIDHGQVKPDHRQRNFYQTIDGISTTKHHFPCLYHHPHPHHRQEEKEIISHQLYNLNHCCHRLNLQNGLKLTRPRIIQ